MAHQYDDNSDSLKDSSEERERIMAAGLAASREGSMGSVRAKSRNGTNETLSGSEHSRGRE